MANPVIINPTMTLAGQAAAINASNTGLELVIDGVSFGRAHYDPTGDEIALVDTVGSRIPLAGGSRPTPFQLRMSAAWKEDVGVVPIGEIGFWAGEILVFVWSDADPAVIASYKTDGVTYVLFCDLAFAQVPANSVTIVVDPGESAALAALSEHEGSASAHPQYMLRSDMAKDAGPLMGLKHAAGSTANALVFELDAPESVLPDYAKFQRFQFVATATNGPGGVTAKIEGHGEIPVMRGDDAGLKALDAGDIKEGALYDLNYDGANFQLGGGVGGGGKAFERFSFVAGVAQAVFNFPHTPGSLIGLRNGREIYDFASAGDGSKVTLAIPANLDDRIEFLAFKSFKVADSYTKAELNALLITAGAMPVGSMLPMPTGVVPPGYLELDGSVKSIAVYPDLAAYLGTAFNTGGEGAGNFRLPDSRGEFLRGWDHGRGVDAGRGIGSTQADQMQRITGTLDPINSGTAFFNGTGALKKIGGNVQSHTSSGGGSSPGGLEFDSANSPGARTGAETRSRNLAVMWCIKAWNAPINQGNIDIAALAAQVIAATPKDYVVGFATAMNVAAPTTTIDVAPGTARGASNPVFSMATISCVLQAAGAWSPGSGGNKLDAGARVALTWYHLFSLRKIAGGEADLLLSTSLAAPAVPPGYELVTRLKGRALKTDASGNIIPFINTGNSTDWKTLQPDMSLSMGTPGSFTITISAPPGVRVRSRHYAAIMGDGPTIYVRSPDANAATLKSLVAGAGFAGGIGQNNGAIAGENIAGYCEASTNLSAQVVVQAFSAPGYDMPEVKLFTLGWTED